ncbi:MAG TPA: transporter, partial [Flavobacteriaceae bacterium]|nr:transporter [Flavobacteriaceae bacterium]
MKQIVYLSIGIFFGIIMYKSEAASWFRIYEMFQFGSFHMYGIIGSALVLGVIGIQIIKKKDLKAVGKQQMRLSPKEKGFSRYVIG